MRNNENGYQNPNNNNMNHGEGYYGGYAYEDPFENRISIGRLMSIIWRNKWMVAGTILVACAISLGVAYTMTPIYQSEGSLLISKSNDRSSTESDLASLLTSKYGIGTGVTIGNELEILRSRQLADEIAAKLIKEKNMENGKQFPVLWTSYPEDPTIVSQDTVSKRIQNNLVFNQVNRDANVVNVIYRSREPHEAARMVNLAINSYSELLTDQKKSMASSATDFLKEEKQKVQDELAASEDELQSFMNNKQLVEVDAQTQDLIERISQLETERQNIKVSLASVNSAINKYEDQLESIKPGLADQYADAVAPKMQRYQYQLAELETQKMLILSKNPSLKDNPDKSPEVRQLNEKIASLRNEVKGLTEKLIDQGDQYLGFLGNSSGNMAENVSSLHQRLIELKVEKSQYEEQLTVMDKRLAGQQQFFDNLPANMMQLAKLKRDVKINEDLFMSLSNQYADMTMWKQNEFGMGRPIDYGYVPETPSWPNKKLFLVIGFVLGSIAAAGFVFTKERFSTSIDGIEKLEKRGLPVLGVIPDLEATTDNKITKKGTFNVTGHPISNTVVTLFDFISAGTEAFRQLRNNILYAQPDSDLKTMIVTSPAKGDGKTTISANLGVVLAETAKNVLIMDVDFRRPNIHNKFGLSQEPGTMDVLFDDVRLEDAIQHTIVNGLDVLSAGKIPANPAGVLQNIGMVELIENLKYKYDYIILDTTPYGIISDAAPLLKFADATIMVSRFNKTEEAQLDQTLDKLERIKVNTLGVVLTGFDYKKSSDYHRNNYYKYAYAYEEYRSYMKDTD